VRLGDPAALDTLGRLRGHVRAFVAAWQQLEQLCIGNSGRLGAVRRSNVAKDGNVNGGVVRRRRQDGEAAVITVLSM
jgi:hypothetical protein